jgi:hypothetical protein
MAVQPIDQRVKLVGPRTHVHGRLQQPPRFRLLPTVERCHAAVEQLLGAALALGERATRPIDVRASTRLAPIEKERARPDVDRAFEASSEVVVESGKQQLLDFRVAIGVRRVVESA